ncbi:50S ribosomal protein L6 [Methylophilaceae bacterium]|jgi:large subunit ribosomal protein L6|nr:50S ribosomal protein L6 [Nitrosomonadales bacterium]MCH9771875.1 50S ribosomal protein L6 [Betaproteobacteria bacterium]MDA9086303.1 50S ribosomal protein L6 [Methylophilaceae bacterium]
MSRVANNPVVIPEKVEITLTDNNISVKGPLGEMNQDLKGQVEIKKEENTLLFSAKEKTKHSIAMSGTIRALTQNMVTGVTTGFEKKLQLIGVGYKAQAQGNKINLELGFSHSIIHDLPEGVTAQTPSQTEIVLKSSNKQVVGQVAAEIRAYRPPEPYKGKGVRYDDEHVVMKEAKKA